MIGISFLIGIFLGILFFGGLQLTLTQLEKSKYPAFLMLSSMLLRMAVVLTGFFLLRNRGWNHLLASLLAVLLVRTLFVSAARKKAEVLNSCSKEKEGSDGNRS
ncbi:ATP synthase subunit I [Anaerobium acetethylicum]|uniref:F1/F0 ATPase, subunit 2 n=1 Tax=Anaerobium acetethylicum TaxID=1619234 RepID=A0A1D3TR53_9FIRM|nr:ATP synthase subunit I [Anaerobium acetethylicum]SCP96141.1 F1/F0 ATPase, subunit 2 [Anaerobium acetethylicum]